MNRPTPTQGAQSEAARVPRVSDRDLDIVLRSGFEAIPWQSIAYDLRDERQASRDDRVTIADLERRLAEDKAVYQRALTKAGQDLCEMASWMSRANDLQARLTEAEQRAATAERRGFEAGQKASMADPRSMDLICPICLEGQFDAEGLELHFANGWCEGPPLAPAVPQEGETTP